MRAYFKPLRRKLGVVTLVAACLMSIGWARSLVVGDAFQFTAGRGGAFHQFASEFGAVQWSCWRINRYLNPEWATWPIAADPFGNAIDRDDNWSIHYGSPGKLASLTIPYWMIVVPLTLLSAWLLLSKSRRLEPKPISEPT